MPYIAKDFIQNQLMPSLDIVQVLQQYLSLKKHGADYVCCCPFHSEKTPSFHVSPSRQFFYCFGCQEHGTVIDFVMKYKNESFPEAVEELARFAGVEVEYEKGAKPREVVDRNKQAYELLDRLASYFTKSLYANQAALDYFTKQRELSTEIISKARLGYAPSSSTYIQEHIAKNENEAKILHDIGLLRDSNSDKQKYRCFFFNRVIIPIFDVKGRIIGFGGRLLSGDGPKYINSPESEIFQKRRELFGLYECLQATRNRPEQVIMVEGYMDVIALRQAGFNNVVATLGTACNSEHFKLLFKYTNRVICCYDGDNAGQKATWKAAQALTPVLPDDKEVRFASIIAGHDPDSLVREQGKAGFDKIIENSVGFMELILLHCRSKHNVEDLEGLNRFMLEVLRIGKSFKSSVRRTSLLMMLSKVLDISVDRLSDIMSTLTPDPEFLGDEERYSHSSSEYSGNKSGSDYKNHAPYDRSSALRYGRGAYQNKVSAVSNSASLQSYYEQAEPYSTREMQQGYVNLGGKAGFGGNGGLGGTANFGSQTGYGDLSTNFVPPTDDIAVTGSMPPASFSAGQSDERKVTGQLIRVDPRNRKPVPARDLNSPDFLYKLTNDERFTYQTVIGQNFDPRQQLSGSVYQLLAFIIQEPAVILMVYDKFKFDTFMALCQGFRIPEYPCFERVIGLIRNVKDINSARLIESFRDTEFEKLFIALINLQILSAQQKNLEDLTSRELMFVCRRLMLQVLYDVLNQRLLQLQQDANMPRYKTLEADFINQLMAFMALNTRLDYVMDNAQLNKYADKINKVIQQIDLDMQRDYVQEAQDSMSQAGRSLQQFGSLSQSASAGASTTSSDASSEIGAEVGAGVGAKVGAEIGAEFETEKSNGSVAAADKAGDTAVGNGVETSVSNTGGA